MENSAFRKLTADSLPVDFTAAKHYHAQSDTWVVVTQGAMYFEINGEPVTVTAGEGLFFKAGTHETVVKVDPGTQSHTIHAPSISGGDKVMVS